jgi:hypothetical protein
MSEAVVVAVLALVGNLIGSYATSQKTAWRIEQLEKKVELHNSVVERVAIMEHDEQTQWDRIEEIRAELSELKEKR